MSEIMLSSSVLIILLYFLRFLLKGRISSRLQYALWGLVVLRLVIPGSLEIDSLYRSASPAGISNVVEIMQEQLNESSVQPPSGNLPDMAVLPEVTNTLQEATLIQWNWLLPAVWALGTIVIMIWMLYVNIRFRN